MPKLMFIASSDYGALVAKGVSGMLAERSEGGYFEKVISVHPFARMSRVISVSEAHSLVEFGFDAFPGGARYRALRFAYAPLYLLRSVLGIRRLVRRELIDIVRASDPYWAAMVGYLGTRFTRAHFVISIHADWEHLHRLDPVHGAPKLFGFRGPTRLLARFVLRRAEWVLCVRPSLVEPAVHAGAVRDRIRLIPHGIDLRPFLTGHQLPDLGLPADRRLVVFAGRLSRENYIDDVVEVGRRLASRGDVCLVVVGGGPEEGRLRRALAMDPSLADAIRLTGFIGRDDVLALRCAAAVNLAPMGGFSLIEACASGRPTVAYDVQWHAELIENRRSGLLVPEADAEALTHAVNELLDNEALARGLGEKGRERAFALHELEVVMRKRAAVYGAILGEDEK